MKCKLLPLILFMLSLPLIAQGAVYLDFDSGSGTTFDGYTWYETTDCDPYCGANAELAENSSRGWRKTGGSFVSGSTNWQPRMANKGGYGNVSTAIIDITNRAPSTTTGGSLKIYDDETTEVYQAGWWLLYNANPLGNNAGYTWSGDNLTDETTNRWSMYLKTEGTSGVESSGNGIHIANYLCSGDSCPTEGPNDQHYYWYLTGFPNDMWVHVLLDRHPTHRRGACDTESQTGCVVGDDPAFTTDGMHMFNNMMQYYIEIRDAQVNPTSLWVDEIEFYTETQLENDLSVTGLFVGYAPSDDTWRLSFNDMSFQSATGTGTTSDNSYSTFEVKYSTQPITNENYDSATALAPLMFQGPEYTPDPMTFRRNRDSLTVYTTFKIPDNIEEANPHLYFAVKDVSVLDGNAGTLWPWTRLDGHDAPSPYIKTIDYYMPINSPETPPHITHSVFTLGGVYFLKLGD